MNCTCGKPRMYGDECRGCYENRLRHQARDAYDKHGEIMWKRIEQRDRCRARGILRFRSYESESLYPDKD